MHMGDLKIVVAGCVAQQEGATLLRRVPEVDLVMGPQYANRCRGSGLLPMHAGSLTADCIEPGMDVKFEHRASAFSQRRRFGLGLPLDEPAGMLSGGFLVGCVCCAGSRSCWSSVDAGSQVVATEPTWTSWRMSRLHGGTPRCAPNAPAQMSVVAVYVIGASILSSFGC